ncbi:preprotein translocase subunit SecA [Stieleria varia]|uniref:Protein translocase subunit SecA n=1 Tax=Stieleria varia TaxID=2528005 RepID=A0A5C6B8H3_9BACT|nr:preprotein translocase subunit SecA [Stieleria varia]TWU08260.1 preprotein translocase subunit SecA [Stieleria varia]
MRRFDEPLDRTEVATRVARNLSRDRWLESIISLARQRAKVIRGMSAEQLRQETVRLRIPGTVLDVQRVAMATAAVIEAVRRVQAVELFDTQLRAGLIVGCGAIAEMQTGEGKTLAGVIPAYLHSLSGRGVHVATTNAYLARRDHQLLSPIFQCLDVSAGLVEDEADFRTTQMAYRCDVTFGSGYAFGFDYMRDQLALRAASAVELGTTTLHRIHGFDTHELLRQRGLNVAIIDEADQVMIDDAVSPLLLSGPRSQKPADAEVHLAALTMVEKMRFGDDFRIDQLVRAITLTDEGHRKVYSNRRMTMHHALMRPWHEYVALALKAKHLVHRDVHYIVSGQEIQIVDESTGRIFSDRTWSDGLHQAVQAAEELPITAETRALAKITRQRFFRLYGTLGGMTGTADGCQTEFESIYGTPVVRVPTRNPNRRVVFPTRICRNANEKAIAIAAETEEMLRAGRAVLIGTHSIAQSELIVAAMTQRSIPVRLLNGVQDESEAEIIARAGVEGAVTVATNLAGRGTDIRLDDAVARRGGLHVIVSQHHPMARVDRQMIGRAARCGDPGSASFYIAADDEWIQQHAPWLARTVRHITDSGMVPGQSLDRHVARAQRRCEIAAAQARHQLLKRDEEAIALMRAPTFLSRLLSKFGVKESDRSAR